MVRPGATSRKFDSKITLVIDFLEMCFIFISLIRNGSVNFSTCSIFKYRFCDQLKLMRHRIHFLFRYQSYITLNKIVVTFLCYVLVASLNYSLTSSQKCCLALRLQSSCSVYCSLNRDVNSYEQPIT